MMGSDEEARGNRVPLRAVVFSRLTCAYMPTHVGSWWHCASTSLVPVIHKKRGSYRIFGDSSVTLAHW